MIRSTRKYAILTGVSLIIMAVAAGFAYGYAHGDLIDLEDPNLTLVNLNQSPGLWASEIFAWIVILLTDLLVTWGLYRYFFSVHRSASLITGFLRLVYSAILAIAIYQLVMVWQILQTNPKDGSDIIDAIRAFEQYWSVGLIIFGFHLMGLGFLSLRSKDIPRWIGWLLWIAGISYSCMNGAEATNLLSTDIIATLTMIFGAPMALAEIGLAIWLIWKGGKLKLNSF